MDFLKLEYFYELFKNNVGTVVLILLLVFLYNYYTATHNYFREKGVPYLKPKILLGNIARRVFLRISFHDFVLELYEKFSGLPYGGFFEGRRPLLLLRCPDLLKAVMIKDFDNFVDRNTMNTNAPPAFSKMLINLKGKEWKSVRTILTPTFSSGKLRNMENLIQQCGEQMTEYLKNRKDGDTDLEMKDFIGRFTLEVIGSCAFGLNCASLKDPNARFFQDATKFAEISLLNRSIFFFTLIFCPTLLKYLPIRVFNKEALDSLTNVVMSTKQKREENNEKRNDFLQLMMEAAKKEIEENAEEKVMTEGIIQAQAVIFLFAGYETTSTLLSFACAIFCEYPEIQDKLRKEIMEASKNSRNCTYDMLADMPYMEKVILETLRMYPPVTRVDRVCVKPYTLPGTNVSLEKGDVVVIPISGVMMDPEHYPNPHVFDPERFSPEEKAKRSSHLFLPFGAGPRNCIGLRFALMSAKFALFYLLRDFKVSRCEKTVYPITFDKRSFMLKAEKGIWVKVEPIS